MEIINQILSGEKSISSSALKEAKKSTREFLWYYSKPKDRKGYFDFGNCLELYLIDKDAFYKEVAVMDESKKPEPDKDYRTKVNQEWKASFYEKNANKYIIPATGEDSFETIQYLEELAQKHPAYDLLLGKEYQKPFEWICPRTGLKRYARTDLYEPGIIIDIKTDANDDFVRTCVKNDYFTQAFDQMIGAVESGAMEEVKDYYWFVLGKKAPYFVDVYRFDTDAMLKVEESYWSALMRIKTDLSSGEAQDFVWRDLPIQKLTVPNYYK